MYSYVFIVSNGNVLKDIKMIMKTIKNYCNVILLYKMDYYKND